MGGDLVEFTESEEKLADTSTDQQLEWDHSVDLESPERRKSFTWRLETCVMRL